MTISPWFGRRRVSIVAATAMLLLGVPIVSVAVGATPASAAGTVTIYKNSAIQHPWGITAGPDGAMWYANQNGSTIGRITTSGAVTTFTDPSINHPQAITAGPDGALWFTNLGFTNVAASIGRITTSGVVTNYTDPTIDGPSAITAGPDGALWFTNEVSPNGGGGSIGRITTSGIITDYPNPTGDPPFPIDGPKGITTGPDGALWFTNYDFPGSIGRITTSGIITSYRGIRDLGVGQPIGIAAGPDGALWFTDSGGSPGAEVIGRITTSGDVTGYADRNVPAANPQDITVGPDGALWFTNGGVEGTSIGRITTAGAMSAVQDPGMSTPVGIAAGPDGKLWFTDNSNRTIGSVIPEPTIVPGGASIVEGNSGTTTLNVPVTLSFAYTQTVTANWTTLFTPGAVNQADPSSDYTAASGTVTFAPGETSKTVPISVNGDTLVEPDEYIPVSFSNPTNAVIGGYYGLGFGVITNDDHATIVPGSASVLEGNSGTTNLNVPVTLSNPSTQTITAHWATDFVPGAPPGEADPASDYTATSGTVTFAPGQTSQTITISVNGDTTVEPDEYILIPFTNPTNATLGGFYGIGFGGILNDD